MDFVPTRRALSFSEPRRCPFRDTGGHEAAPAHPASAVMKAGLVGRGSGHLLLANLETRRVVDRPVAGRIAPIPALPRKEESALAQFLQTQPTPPAESDRPPAKARVIAMPRHPS
jgi:hypothetical protein